MSHLFVKVYSESAGTMFACLETGWVCLMALNLGISQSNVKDDIVGSSRGTDFGSSQNKRKRDKVRS